MAVNIKKTQIHENKGYIKNTFKRQERKKNITTTEINIVF